MRISPVPARRSASLALLTGLAVAGALSLSACGAGSTSTTAAGATPAAATATQPIGPVPAAKVESCINATGLYVSSADKKADGARFGADEEIQLDVDKAGDSLGVFVYSDPSATVAGKSQIEEAGGQGVEVVNNSVFSGAGELTGPDAQAGLAKVRSCANTGA